MSSLTFFGAFVVVLALLLLAASLVFASSNPYKEKTSAFECGFHSFLGQNRSPFTISFYLMSVLFIPFDVELSIGLPGILDLYSIESFGAFLLIIFLLVLGIGFVFEIGKNALKIDSRQFNIEIFERKNVLTSDLL